MVIFKNSHSLLCLLLFSIVFGKVSAQQNQNITIDEHSPYLINPSVLGRTPIGGDTIFIASTRVRPLRFEQLEGNSTHPIVIINKGGQVKINATANGDWGALVFYNTKYIKVSGAGHPGFKYGFQLTANETGLAFVELSSDCEAEFIKISHDGFFGILAKKDYDGNPPVPHPVFNNLVIHDCFIEGVSEGMYLGETKSPGMEFRHVKIYNNIVRNTLRESIQIANMPEDVEIYNNTLINAGLEGLIYHTNNLQIGNNSVVNVYNNIIIGAPAYGIINFGKGNCTFSSNYIASSTGIFCDNQSFSDSLAPILIADNYFKSLTGPEVIKNLNENNFLTASNNVYDVPMNFYNDGTVPNNESIVNNTLTTISEIQFEDVLNNNYALASNTASEYLGMGAPGGPEFFDYDDPATTPRQLIITPTMVADSVTGGSVNSPLYLFDEQNVDISSDQHPISQSWKPDYLMNETSYHAVVDLGDEHYISEINLHDMHDTHNFTVEYYNGSSWNTLFVEPCDAFNTWKTHATAIETRYLRFSIYDSPNAAVNEIIIYGYPIIRPSEQIVIDSSMVTDLVSGGSSNTPNYLFDEQSISVQNDEHPVSQSWKPFYNNSNAPYYIEIDLGTEYHISKINLHDMNDVADFVIQYKDGENWIDLVTESCNSYNVWKSHHTNVVTRYLRLVMPISPHANVNEIIVHGYAVMSFSTSTPTETIETIEQQILVESHMVNDLVSGGSADSPLYLFDEQQVNPLSDEHAISKSWKPFHDNTGAPYYVEIDLENTYKISKIFMHDMHSTHNFIVEYEDNSSWVSLVVESCDAFNAWKIHNIDITTSKLRLSMLDSPYASVNEILLYGQLIQENTVNSSSVSNDLFENILINERDNTDEDATEEELNGLEFYPNPVKNTIFLQGIESDSNYSEIRIMDAFLGTTLYYSRHANPNHTNTMQIDISNILNFPSVYVLLYSNDKGQQKSFKFIKD
ncbi:hypothetical protein GTQ40_17120 [Flavobacteriaceae bacterium R38]|nr:hypothetical protein [Flavobacteriaceae bacterium R38]